MRKVLFFGFAAGMAGAAFAGLYGDAPDAKHAWAVHDWNRPNPASVTADNLMALGEVVSYAEPELVLIYR